MLTDFFVHPADDNARLRLVQSGFEEGPGGQDWGLLFLGAIAAGLFALAGTGLLFISTSRARR